VVLEARAGEPHQSVSSNKPSDVPRCGYLAFGKGLSIWELVWFFVAQSIAHQY